MSPAPPGRHNAAMSRYSRQELFAPIGPEGQARIAASRVLLVGCGALGSHLAEFCARAGVGRLLLIDRDIVEESNLQRQGLFTEADVRQSMPKAVAAARHLQAINSACRVQALVGEFGPANAEELVRAHDLVLDATDNFDTRFLVNEACVKWGVPWVYAACVSSRAACMPVLPGGACLACLLEEPPQAGGETCETAGVIMPAVLQAVAWSSVVALKILSGNPAALFRRMFSVDLWSGERTSLDASRPRAGCPVCQERRWDYLEGRRGLRTAVLCGRHSVQIRPQGVFDFVAQRARLREAGAVKLESEYLLQLKDGDLELTLFADGRGLVHGTSDEVRARSLYARWVG